MLILVFSDFLVLLHASNFLALLQNDCKLKLDMGKLTGGTGIREIESA